MKKRLPRKRTATAVAAAVLLFGHAVIGVYAVSQQDASADQPLFSTAASSNKSWWKAAISDYDASLSLVQYEEVEPTPEDLAAQQDALKVMASLQELLLHSVLYQLDSLPLLLTGMVMALA